MGKRESANNLYTHTQALASRSALILKLVLALLCVPLIIGITVALTNSVISLGHIPARCFGGGIISYLVLHFFIYRPAFFYKKGQDVLRFIFAFFSPLVRIASYLLPIYSILIIACFIILSLTVRNNLPANIFLFFVSFSLIFHLIFTAEDLRDRQTGLARSDYFFSFSIIYLLNIIMLGAGLHFMFDKFSFLKFLSQTGRASLYIYQSVFTQLFV